MAKGFSFSFPTFSFYNITCISGWNISQTYPLLVTQIPLSCLRVSQLVSKYFYIHGKGSLLPIGLVMICIDI